MKPEDAPFPTEEWFDENELDYKLHAFSYEVNGHTKEVAFWIRSISNVESRTISGRNEDKDGKIDDAKHSDDMMRSCLSYGPEDNRTKVSQQMIDGMKRNKKGGLYGQILMSVLIQSGANQELIDAEKNSESPIASSQSS